MPQIPVVFGVDVPLNRQRVRDFPGAHNIAVVQLDHLEVPVAALSAHVFSLQP